VASLNRRDTDAELIAAFQSGDRSALAGLYQLHKDQVYSVAFYFFRGDANLAADITQQVFLKLMTDIGKFRGASEFSTWLYRMVVNTCIDASRKHKKEVVPIREIAAASPDPNAKSPAAQWESKQLDQNVRAAVDALPEPFRIAVLLRHFEELSYEEMAVALECSIGTVSSRLSRAHKLLAESLAPVRAWFEAKE
jgi:RNA polymerase sigma-70 factor, ECF subfamily